MTDLTHRPYADGDTPAITKLMNAVAIEAGADPTYTDFDIDRRVSRSVRDPERDTRLTFAPDDHLIAFGMVGAPPVGGTLVDTFGGVHPLWQGRGLGHELFVWQVDRIAAMRDEVAPGEEWHVNCYTSVLDEGAIHMYENFDMAPVRYFLEMRADPATAPEIALPDGVRLAPYTADLAGAVYQAHMEAFADHWGFQHRSREEWEPVATGSPGFRPDMSFVALAGGDEIAGYLLAYDGADNVHVVGQVGTLAAWRRRGIAVALLSASMRAAAALGKTVSALGVDADSPTGAVGLYERVGYSAHSRFVTYQRALPPGAEAYPGH